jgi:hypothetical protein
MRNVLQDKLPDHWSRLEQFYAPFYDNTMTQVLAHTANVLHFQDNSEHLTEKKNKTI